MGLFNWLKSKFIKNKKNSSVSENDFKSHTFYMNRRALGRKIAYLLCNICVMPPLRIDANKLNTIKYIDLIELSWILAFCKSGADVNELENPLVEDMANDIHEEIINLLESEGKLHKLKALYLEMPFICNNYTVKTLSYRLPEEMVLWVLESDSFKSYLVNEWGIRNNPSLKKQKLKTKRQNRNKS